MCAITHSYMWRDSFTCVPRLIHGMEYKMYQQLGDTIHAYVCYGMSHTWRSDVSRQIQRSTKNVCCSVLQCVAVCCSGTLPFAVSYFNESCRTCEWVMSHMWMSHVSHVNESCRTCEWVMSHMWMSHVSHVNESCLSTDIALYEELITSVRCLIFKSVMFHMWMSHVSHVNESCLIF